MAGGSQCFESKPHRQLPFVPQPCCCGCTSLSRQQAQQPFFCTLCVTSCSFLPSRRDQPLHCGQYHYLLLRFLSSLLTQTIVMQVVILNFKLSVKCCSWFKKNIFCCPSILISVSLKVQKKN